MHAIRLARGYTNRDKIIKIDGCYHGAHDSVLVKAGSGVATLALPGSPGVPAAVAANTLVAPFNDLDAIETLLDEHGDDIATLIIEPVTGNMGCIAPAEGYLQGLRDLCDTHGVVLIFDEVMTGFRVHKGCAQALYGVTPDLTTLGKIVGGGYPMGAFGGKAEIMDSPGAPSDRSTRLAPCRGTRSRWRPASRPSSCSTMRCTSGSNDSGQALEKGDRALAELPRLLDEPRRLDVHGVLPAPAPDQLRRGQGVRPARVLPLLPVDAERRGLPPAQPVRGGIHLARLSDDQMMRVIDSIEAAVVAAHAH